MNRFALTVLVLLVIGPIPAPGTSVDDRTGVGGAVDHHAIVDTRQANHSLADVSLQWPEWDVWVRVLLLRDYNTRVVVLGTTLLGCAAAMVGSFALLRRRALMGDAISHATLPGICLAFMIATRLGYDSKSLVWLLIGATVTGMLGVATVLLIRNTTRLKEDTALGAVLSVFFGAGIALMGVVQQMDQGHAAGLESFIYGKTASMGMRDIQLIGIAACVCILICLVFFKELKLLCFDETFAGAQGYPIIRLDMLLMALVTVVCIVGLQAVGLILMIALLVIPAAAARFWTDVLWRMFLVAGLIGALSGWIGASASALLSKLPSGAMIVMVSTGLFMGSMMLGTSRGVVARGYRRHRLNRAISRQHLLRAMYEILEQRKPTPDVNEPIAISDLMTKRSWSYRKLLREINRAQADRLVVRDGSLVRLTESGFAEAARLTRQHRLWELYLIHYADVAPGMVDRGADAIEHVLDPDVIARLESLLQAREPTMPASPHTIDGPAEAATPSQSEMFGPNVSVDREDG